MIYVGIDVASDKHDYFILQSNTGLTPCSTSVTIPNSILGFEKLHKDITAFCEATNDSSIKVGLESTGIYHLNILTFLINHGYDVMLINPILTNMSRKSSQVHCPKNDNLDAQNICNFLHDNRYDFKPYFIVPYQTEALKSLSRKRFDIVEDLRQSKIVLNNLIQTTFPEFKELFSNIYKGSAINILSKYKVPLNIAKARPSSLAKLIHGRCKCSADEIINAAKNTVGINGDYLSIQIEDTIEDIKYCQSRIDKYDEQIKVLVDSIAPNILSVPGVGYVSAGLILGEIRDISRFHSAESLIAFAGLDIEVFQSGKYIAKNRHPSKKGSRYLRYALFQASRIAWQCDPVFNAYYEKKKKEGKHYYVILGHIQKKLIRVIYSVLKNNSVYEVRA